jgi:hypothetical protein
MDRGTTVHRLFPTDRALPTAPVPEGLTSGLMRGILSAGPALTFDSTEPAHIPCMCQKCVELRDSSLQGASRQQSLARSQGELVETEVGKQGAA